MQDTVLGINDATLSEISLSVLDYVDDLSDIFENIDKQMNLLSNYYQGKSRVIIDSYYKDIRSNYPTIKSNIKSYSDDFISLINKMNDNDTNIANLFQGYIDETNKKVKSETNEEAIKWL